MADIQIEYREYQCLCGCENHCGQCYTSVAEDMGCPLFNHRDEKENGTIMVLYDCCKYASYTLAYKGIVAKRYTMTEYFNPYEYPDSCMKVTVGGKTYDCEKVIIDGTCVYGGDSDAES